MGPPRPVAYLPFASRGSDSYQLIRDATDALIVIRAEATGYPANVLAARSPAVLCVSGGGELSLDGVEDEGQAVVEFARVGVVAAAQQFGQRP